MTEPTMYFTEDQFNQLVRLAGLTEADAPSTLDVVAYLREICRSDQRQRNALQRILQECGGHGFYGEPEKIADEAIRHIRGGTSNPEARTRARLEKIVELSDAADNHRARAAKIRGYRPPASVPTASGAEIACDERIILIQHHEQEAERLIGEALKCL